jgi:hypothetical protein
MGAAHPPQVKETRLPDPNTVTSDLAGDTGAEVVRVALTSREPDGDVHQDDIAWWLALQERIEIRAELAARGLL